MDELGRRRRAILMATVAVVLGGAAASGQMGRVARSARDAVGLGPDVPATAGPLEGRWADYAYWAQTADDAPATAIPLQVRNRGSSPIVLESVTVDHAVGLEVSPPSIIGPQSPTLANVLLRGWPPVEGGNPIPRLGKRSPVRGYVLLPTGSRTPDLTMPNHEARDRPHDASPIFRVVRSNRHPVGYLVGITVRYRYRGKVYERRFPHAELGLCSLARWNADTCGRQRRRGG